MTESPALDHQIGTAIARAAEFLRQSRDAHGWWSDLVLPPGPSDEWVTGYVGAALATVPNPDCQAAAQQAWSLLVGRRSDTDGWAYNAAMPGDADSTIAGLRLAEALGHAQTSRARGARQFLMAHLRPDGGLATYGTDGPIRRWSKLAPEVSFEGWLISHTCVTAAGAALAGMGEHVRGYLRRTQRQDGSWLSYWWCEQHYATALAAEGLAASGAPEDRAAVAQAVDWGLTELSRRGFAAAPNRPGGITFGTAWCLRLLRLAHDPTAVQPAADTALRWLLAQQRPDGSWSAAAQMRVTPTAVLDLDSMPRSTLTTVDMARNFTTATILAALQRLRGD